MDITGHGHDLVGAGSFTLNNDVIGLDGFQYASFDGATVVFTPANPAGLHPSRFTLLAIVQPTAADGYWWSSELNTAAADFSCITSAAGAYGARCQGATPLDPRNWGFYGGGFLLYVCTYDGTFVGVSINGQVQASAALSGYVPGTVAPVIGRYAQGGHFLKGGVSDIALIPSAIAGSDLVQLGAIAGLPSPGSNPLVTAQLDSISSRLDLQSTALAALSTLVNEKFPPVIALLGHISTHHLTGFGSLALVGTVYTVTMDFVPVAWGYAIGQVNTFENRLAQLVFSGVIPSGPTQVPIAISDQHENVRTYIFEGNLPTILEYDVAPGAGIIVQQYA